MKELIKSSINYTGNKWKLLPTLFNELKPEKLDKFKFEIFKEPSIKLKFDSPERLTRL